MTQFKFNVAQLLRENIGARRDYAFTEDHLPLDETLVLRDIVGNVRFVRSATGVFSQMYARGVVRLVCVRSLEEFDLPVELNITEEIHSVVDVFTGTPLARPSEEDPFFLTDTHMADVGEIVREYTLLELPLNPVCEKYRDTPVQYSVQSEGVDDEASGDEAIDARFAALKDWVEQQKKQSDTNSS